MSIKYPLEEYQELDEKYPINLVPCDTEVDLFWLEKREEELELEREDKVRFRQKYGTRYDC